MKDKEEKEVLTIIHLGQTYFQILGEEAKLPYEKEVGNAYGLFVSFHLN